jgi:hypothetical protein
MLVLRALSYFVSLKSTYFHHENLILKPWHLSSLNWRNRMKSHGVWSETYIGLNSAHLQGFSASQYSTTSVSSKLNLVCANYRGDSKFRFIRRRNIESPRLRIKYCGTLLLDGVGGWRAAPFLACLALTCRWDMCTLIPSVFPCVWIEECSTFAF